MIQIDASAVMSDPQRAAWLLRPRRPLRWLAAAECVSPVKYVPLTQRRSSGARSFVLKGPLYEHGIVLTI